MRVVASSRAEAEGDVSAVAAPVRMASSRISRSRLVSIEWGESVVFGAFADVVGFEEVVSVVGLVAVLGCVLAVEVAGGVLVSSVRLVWSRPKACTVWTALSAASVRASKEKPRATRMSAARIVRSSVYCDGDCDRDCG